MQQKSNGKSRTTKSTARKSQKKEGGDTSTHRKENANVPLSNAMTNAEVRAISRLTPVLDSKRLDNAAKRGDWIDSDSVGRFLAALEPGGALAPLTYADVDARLVLIYRDRAGRIVVRNPIDDVTALSLRQKLRQEKSSGRRRGVLDVVIVVYDENRRHYFPVMLSVTGKITSPSFDIYVYDSLGGAWTMEAVHMFVRKLFPRWNAVLNDAAVHDRTKDVHQQGDATCGPWTLWLIMAYVSNVHGWREVRPRPMFQTRYALTAYDVFGERRPSRKNELHRRFWMALQGDLSDDELREIRSLPY